MVSAIPRKQAYYNAKKRVYRRRAMRKPNPYALAKRINKIDKAVRINRKLVYGHTQRNLQTIPNAVSVLRDKPCCFQATNFGTGNNSAIWQENSSSAVASVTTFNVYDPVSSGFWANQNNDVPDTGCYRALYANYRFIIQGVSSCTDRWVRIDFVQPRLKALRNTTSTTNPLTLPYALPALKLLCDGNMLNTTYFKIIASKSVYLNSKSVDDANMVNTTGNTKYCNFMLKINKNMYQSLSGTNFGPSNTAYGNQVWCIISSNAVSDTLDHTAVHIHRTVVWRDNKGSDSL